MGERGTGIVGRVLWISSDGDDRKILGGLKFLIPGFLGLGNLKIIFWIQMKLLKNSTCTSI